MFLLWSLMRTYFRASCRFASLLAYAGSILIYYYAAPMAAKAYNDLCALEAGTVLPDVESVKFLGRAMIALAVPVLLARSKTLLIINLSISLITALWAGTLLSTAGRTPFECFSSGGSYDDRTSGLEEFFLWFVFVVFLSCVLLVLDLVIWAERKADVWTARPSSHASRDQR